MITADSTACTTVSWQEMMSKNHRIRERMPFTRINFDPATRDYWLCTSFRISMYTRAKSEVRQVDVGIPMEVGASML